MKKISNTEENNQYYQLVNTYIDKYIKDYKISPANLKNYFKNTKKIESFLKRYDLNEVVGIKRVLNDVLEDWHSIEKDGVMTFESFAKLLENHSKIEFQDAGIEHEKILADLYGTSVGHVREIDKKLHTFVVSDFGKKIHVTIYSKSDLESFKKSILEMLKIETESKKLDLMEIESNQKKLRTNIQFNLSDIIDFNKLNSKFEEILTTPKLLYIMNRYINGDSYKIYNNDVWKFKEEFKGYYIWEVLEHKIEF